MTRGPWRPVATLAVALGLLAARPDAAQAQFDYRNLERARPLFTEDAYAIEQHAFEFVAGYLGGRTADRDRHALAVELEYGLLRNLEIGIGVPVVVSAGGGEEAGFGAVGASMLYNLNSETPRLPALALRSGVELPTGAFGPEHPLGRVGAVLTRSFGRTRLHVNGTWDVGPVAEEARWHASLALDRTLLFSSTLLGAEVVVDGDDAGETATAVAAGLRRQLTPTLVVDAGVLVGIAGDGPDLALTLGFSKVFGVAGLIRVPRPQASGGAPDGPHDGP